jgi:hypothetical protein
MVCSRLQRLQRYDIDIDNENKHVTDATNITHPEAPESKRFVENSEAQKPKVRKIGGSYRTTGTTSLQIKRSTPFGKAIRMMRLEIASTE